MPQTLPLPALRRLLLLLLLLTCWAPAGYGDTGSTAESPLSATHYLIPGFSNHLLHDGLLIYEDLLEARNAVRSHRTLSLRLALADASGHLLQLSTPPSLAGLRQQMMTVRQALSGQDKTSPSAAWAALIASIDKLPMHRADRAARARLRRTAERGRHLTAKGNAAGARAELSKLVAEIEITSHVFPIATVRKNVGIAVKAASAFTPRWSKARKAIADAIGETRWITRPEANHMIHAFDAMVAAYVQFPDSSAQARRSLQHARWWLSRDRSDGDGDGDSALLHDIRQAARAHDKLTLQRIGRLQTRLAYSIHHERLASEKSH
ncbi:MAG: hypothetical protein P8Y78_03620 [Acidihalobacter sp.]